MNKEYLKNSDYINTFYEATLSAACRYHCVSHYDEAGLILGVRQDIVEAGIAPAKVKALAAELEKVQFKVAGTGDVLYFEAPYDKKSSLFADCKVIFGGDCGKALDVLGFKTESEKVFARFKAAVADSGCKTLVVSCPASYSMLKGKIEGIEVLHSSEYLLNKKLSSQGGKAYYLESDYLKNYCDNLEAPRELLKKCGYELIPFGTNPEESYAVGEGAVVYDILNPDKAEKLCKKVLELADAPANDILITASPYTKYALNKYAPELTVLTLEEAVNGGIK